MLKNRAAFGLVAFIALTAGRRLPGGENWPQFRGPDGQGHSDATRLPVTWSESEHIRWKTPIHDRGWSSPVVWGDQIWLTTATPEGTKLFAVCIDMATGRIVHDIKVFDVEKPANTQQYNSFASPTPAIEKDRVYISFGSYGTACLDTHTGKTLWNRQDLPCNHFRGPGSSPVIFENLLLLHFDGFDYQYAVALDKQTGNTVWKTDRAHDYGTDDGDMKKAFSTPLVIEAAGRLQMISPCAKAAFAYDPRTGKEIWRVRFPSHSAAARPLFAEGLVFIDTGFSKADLLAIRPDGEGDVTKSNIVWKATKGIGSKPSPVLVDGLIYVVSDGGVASCLEAKSGKEVWTHRLGGEFSAALVAARDRIYFCDEQGKTTVIKAGRQYQELATNTLDDGCKASPAVVGQALILRTKSALYRIEAN
jgi:outer membrane protein assembly factor BamB